MKRMWNPGAVLVLSAASFVACTEGGYTVTGRIEGLADGDTLVMTELGHIQKPPMAEAVVKEGVFVFQGDQADPRGVSVAKKGKYGAFQLILDNRDIKVSGTAELRKEAEDYERYEFDVTVEGSPLTDLLKEKQQPREALGREYEAYREAHKEISRQLGEARAANDRAKYEELLQTEAYKALERDEHAFFEKVGETLTKLYRDNRDTWWGPFLMEYNTNYFNPGDTALYNMLSEEAKQSYYGRMVRGELFPEDEEGKPVPSFTLTESEQGEKPVTLPEILAGHKYVLIDFWASWCGPCRKEIPNLKNLYALYADKGLQIVSISLDKSEEAWKKACEEEQLPWLSYRDRSGIDAAYKVQFIPAIFLVDADGCLVKKNVRGEELAALLAKLME